MKILIVIARFIGILLSMLFMVVGVMLTSPFSHKPVHYPLRYIWTRLLIASTGATLKIHNKSNLPHKLGNTLIVSNHISWLDTVVLLRISFMRFIGKIEMLKWPILRTVIKSGDTIFINRKDRRSLPKVNKLLAKLLTTGTTIGLYPEGTTSHGHNIQPFKAPLLEAAIMAKSTIVPIVIRYNKEHKQLATEVTFNGVGWLTTVINTLKLSKLIIHVTILPPVSSNQFSSREELSNHLFSVMTNCYEAYNLAPQQRHAS